MTEQEWLESSDPGPMLKFLCHSRPKERPLKAARRSKRKLGLFICACYRRGWPTLSPEFRTLAEDYERYSDGIMTWQAVERAYWAVIHESEKPRRVRDEKEGVTRLVNWLSPRDYFSDPDQLARRLARQAASEEEAALAAEQRVQCQLLRDIFKPFCSVFLDPALLTATTKQMAEFHYRERVFDSLPVLADALEEASCDVALILEHCRGPGPHVRGCWVLDLILGRE